MIIMSIDLGKARTGIAISDSTENFAFPKRVITEYNTEKLLIKLCDCIKEYGAEKIVVGHPKNMDGSYGERAEECKAIAEKLQEMCGLDVVLWDERCTTLAAYSLLDDSGTFGKKRKEVIDAVAATMILESYLNFLKNSK